MPQTNFFGDTLLICLAASMDTTNIAKNQEKMLFLIEKGISDPRIDGKKSGSLIKVIFCNNRITIDQKANLVESMIDKMYSIPSEEIKLFFLETLRQLSKFNRYVAYESNINEIANFCHPKPSLKNLDTMIAREALVKETLRLYFNDEPKNFDEFSGHFKDLIICGYFSSLELLHNPKMPRSSPNRDDLLKLMYTFAVKESTANKALSENLVKDMQVRPSFIGNNTYK